MKRKWTLAAFAIALMAIGVVVACDANGTKDVLSNAAVSTALAQDGSSAKGCSIAGRSGAVERPGGVQDRRPVTGVAADLSLAERSDT